jgi:hypothetical protein
MPFTRTIRLLCLALLLLSLPAALPVVSLGQEATPAPAARSFHWERIDVTVELREDSSFHVTNREQVAFAGGPFFTGFAEIPLAWIESVDNIQVGEVIDDRVAPFQYVEPDAFSPDVPNTFTYETFVRDVVIEWSFLATNSQSRTFQLDYDTSGALRVYPDAAMPYQEIRWIGVSEELTQAAPVTEASLTFFLPCAIDPTGTVSEVFGSTVAEVPAEDGQTWGWTASDLGRGDSLEALLRFPPLVQAEKPAWQARADRQEQQATSELVATPVPIASPAAATEVGAACLSD